MGKARTNDYISKAFKDRIEVSLANISRRPNDKFTLVGMKMILKTFKCELCGHDPCIYAFSVKNLETDIVMDVGSECINHFKGKMNIDLAEGLKKRVRSIVRKMRRTLKKSVETEEYQTMSKAQKRMLIVRLFAKHQVIEALQGTQKRSLLKKEDVLKTIEDNPWVEEDDTPDAEEEEEKKPVKKTPVKAARKTASASTKN